MTATETEPMLSVDQRIINHCEKACGALGNFIPERVIKDINFFITSPDITPTCKTNTCIAFQIGKLAATATGRDALLVEIIWLCVMAKDTWTKGFFMPSILDILDRVEKLSEAAEIWRIADLNY